MPNSTTPANRRRGSLWAVVTAVVVVIVAYFMFFDSRDGTAPISAPTASTTETPSEGSRAPIPSGVTPQN